MTLFGIMHLDKDNMHARQGSCAACGKSTTLVGYDTASYFEFMLIPLLPLGDKRVIDRCMSCEHRRTMSLRRWRAFRLASVERSLHAQSSAPADPAATRAALETAILFDDEDAFIAAATIAEASHPRDARVLHALAAGYEYLTHHADAEEIYRALVKLDEHDVVARDGLAITLMRQGRPDDAAPVVEHGFRDERGTDVRLVQCLVEAYLEQGNHAAADALLNRCEDVFLPRVAHDVRHQLLRRTTQTCGRTGTAAPSRTLRIGTRRHAEDVLRTLGGTG